MSIQKINSVNLNASKRANSTQSTQNSTNELNQIKQISMKDMLYSYPISFGSSVPANEPKLAFKESLGSYYRLNPDKYQIEAAEYLYENSDPLVPAPTGTGKTLIAEYAINKNLSEDKKTIYTTPLKALSNEKYTDFCKLFGKENVGLLTGDIKINPEAPVLIMTTEIYRNMLVGNKKEEVEDRLKDTATVIYDEFHYMNEPERGEVWETSIMFTPPNVQQLLLSATAENGDVIIKWMNRLLTEKGSERAAKIVEISPDERHVPLKHFIYDPKHSNKNIIPLTTEKYNLPKLGKALNPNSKKNLTDKQIEVLTEVSERAGEKPSPVNGVSVLMKYSDMEGGLEKLEKTLVQRLNYSPLEAQRTAAILSDKSERQLNESLKGTKSDKEMKSAFYSKGKPQKVISPERVNDYLLIKREIPHNESRALMQYSRLMGGDTTVNDGLEKISFMLNKTDMSTKEFDKRLKNSGLNDKLTDKITNLLTVTRYPEEVPEEFDLINILEQEDKLPAIFFKFSKKSCEKLKNDFLKTGKSLLNDDEKLLAAEIIKNHIDKGGFFGTGEEPTSLLSGVAVHNAGKMPAYKALVEELSQNKLLKVVFATSTLGAGINVPAKTVVFTELTRYAGDAAAKDGEKFVSLTANEFQQMSGRAGRRGKDLIGNVVVMPDRDHGAPSIFELATSKPDPIESRFKPSYGLISHLITQDGSIKNIAEVVDKTFLQERLESIGEKPYKVMNKVKDQFKAMSRVLTSEELDYFKEKDGELVPTIRGEVVAKARGIDGIVFAETLFKSGLEHLTPQDMTAVACALTQPDERNTVESFNLSESVIDTLMGIDMLYKKVSDIQTKEHVEKQDLILNRADAQYVAQWANVVDKDSRAEWEKLITANMKEVEGFSEGSFLKTVKDTIDILKQIKETSRFVGDKAAYDDNDYVTAKKMSTIRDNASKAIALLERDPVIYQL